MNSFSVSRLTKCSQTSPAQTMSCTCCRSPVQTSRSGRRSRRSCLQERFLGVPRDVFSKAGQRHVLCLSRHGLHLPARTRPFTSPPHRKRSSFLYSVRSARSCPTTQSFSTFDVLATQAQPLFAFLRTFIDGKLDDLHVSATQVRCWVIDSTANIPSTTLSTPFLLFLLSRVL